MDHDAGKVWLEAVLSDLRREPKNQEAWSLLYTRLWSFVMAINRRVLHAYPEAVEDVTQEVFLRVVRYNVIARVDEPSALFAYIRTISFNVCADYCKAMPEHDHYVPLAFSDDMHPGLFPQSRIAAIGKHLVTAQDRDLFALLVEGCSLNEIAQKQQVTYAAAGTRTHRLIQKLRRLYKNSASVKTCTVK